MKTTILLFVLMVSGLNSPLSAQNWIPRLNKNGTYTLVTDQGSPVNQVQYENVSPLWDGDQYAAWTLNNTSGCIFPNKVSIAYEPNPRVYKDYRIKAVVEKGAKAKDAWKDYRYLVDFAKHNLIVNLKTGNMSSIILTVRKFYRYRKRLQGWSF